MTAPLGPQSTLDSTAAPRGRHRLPVRRAHAPRRWWTVGALIVVTLGLGSALTAITPDRDEQERPFTATGPMRAEVVGRTFTATVLSARGAAKISTRGRDYDTAGVWVLVLVRVSARGEPTALGHASVRDAWGREYLATGRFDQPLAGAGRTIQPGIPVTAEIAFEVPVAVAGDLAVRLSSTGYDQRMDSMIEVDLPAAGAATVAEWARSATPTTLATGMAS